MIQEPLYNETENIIDDLIMYYFNDSKKSYGTRPLKEKLADQGYKISRSKISKRMAYLGLKSTYTKKGFKVPPAGVNHSNIKNFLNRNFVVHELNRVITSDLSYVNVDGRHF